MQLSFEHLKGGKKHALDNFGYSFNSVDPWILIQNWWRTNSHFASYRSDCFNCSSRYRPRRSLTFLSKAFS